MSKGLVHEIWVDEDDLEMCCLAGPDGDGARALFSNARLVHVFVASSHVEAMREYHAFLGREPYTTTYACDSEPYPEAWHSRQAATAREWRSLHARLLQARGTDPTRRSDTTQEPTGAAKPPLAAPRRRRWMVTGWTPIDREKLQHRIERGLEAGGDEVRAYFAQIAREPVKWQLHPWGDLGGGFWIVAVLGDRVVWFNDIEDGFNISTFATEGAIPADEYGCDQEELHWTLRKLVDGGGYRAGPPRPLTE